MENSVDVINKDLDLICGNLNKEFTCLAGKNILIVGGAGFLGYYLVQSLLHWNAKTDKGQHIKVTVYDNFIRGIPGWLTNVNNNNENLKLVKHDITNPLPPDIEDFQYIIHAASIASPSFYRMYPIETMDANVNGLRILLDHCLKKNGENVSVEGFLFFSSSEIYGDPTPENIPTPETYFGHVSCTGPRACYDESKRYAETLCVNFARKYNLPIRIARPFNNYGPGLKISDKRVLPDFSRDVFNGRDIVLLSDGTATRTFCYIADAITGYYKILVKGKNGESYNIGTETPEISMAALAEKVVSIAKDLFNYKGKVVYKVSPDKDYLTHNPNRRCPVITKARNELGYVPRVSLDDGLKRSLLWYNDNSEAENS